MAKDDGFVRYTVRVPADLYARLQDAAGMKSVNAEIVERLQRSFGESPPLNYDDTTLRQQFQAVASFAVREAVQEMMALYPEIRDLPKRFDPEE